MSDNTQTQEVQAQPLPPPPPPGATVVPTPTQLPPGSEAAAQHARRLQGKVPISDVTLIVGRRNKDGLRTEEMTNIDHRDYRITGFSEVIVEKMQKVKDDQGRLMGFEPTGEYELTIKIKYVTE